MKNSRKIEKGYLVLIGIAQTDTKEIADKMMRKLINLRILKMPKEKRIWIFVP